VQLIHFNYKRKKNEPQPSPSEADRVPSVVTVDPSPSPPQPDKNNQPHHQSVVQYDVIVVGGGIMGVSTAYHLALKGKKFVLLEQFEPNHSAGSSHGETRIIRFTYDEEIYVEMAKKSYEEWHEIEIKSGESLITTTGGVDFGPNLDSLASIRNALTAKNIPFETLSLEQASRRFPQFNFDYSDITEEEKKKNQHNYQVIYQKDTGVLFAERAVKALWKLAEQNGAQMLPFHKCISIQLHNENTKKKVVVTAIAEWSERVFIGKKVVLAGGAWTNKLSRWSFPGGIST